MPNIANATKQLDEFLDVCGAAWPLLAILTISLVVASILQQSSLEIKSQNIKLLLLPISVPIVIFLVLPGFPCDFSLAKSGVEVKGAEVE